jgi:hypothetical protein
MVGSVWEPGSERFMAAPVLIALSCFYLAPSSSLLLGGKHAYVFCDCIII